jgi:hypothetical protein
VASAGVVDWGSNWTLAEGNGWYQTGAFNNSTSSDGVTVDVSLQLFGTATGDHNFLPDTPFASDTYNGTQGIGDPALGLGDSNSQNNGTTFDNYVLLSLSFSSPVDITSMAIGDVDINGESWQDAVAVVGSNNNVLANTSYTPGSTSFFETRTFSFPDSGMSLFGVTGLSNAANDGSNGQFDVSFDSMVDRIDIYYWNGPDTDNSASRGIYIQDIGFIPTPGTATAALLGLGMFSRRRRN